MLRIWLPLSQVEESEVTTIRTIPTLTLYSVQCSTVPVSWRSVLRYSTVIYVTTYYSSFLFCSCYIPPLDVRRECGTRGSGRASSWPVYRYHYLCGIFFSCCVLNTTRVRLTPLLYSSAMQHVMRLMHVWYRASMYIHLIKTPASIWWSKTQYTPAVALRSSAFGTKPKTRRYVRPWSLLDL